MSINQFKADVLRLSLADVATAYATLCRAPVASFTKLQQAEWLAQQLHGGNIVWDQLTQPSQPQQRSVPAPFINAVAQDVGALQQAHGDTVKLISDLQANAIKLSRDTRQVSLDVQALQGDISSASTVASRAEQVALDGLIIANRTAADIASIRGQVDRIADTKLDPSMATRAVADAVAAAFKPFEAAVAAAGAQAVVGDMVGAIVVDRQPALDVFGVDIRDTDGNKVLVDIWNDVSRPQIDPCFIWTDSILKVLLLAQDDGMNVWFGGEKG